MSSLKNKKGKQSHGHDERLYKKQIVIKIRIAGFIRQTFDYEAKRNLTLSITWSALTGNNVRVDGLYFLVISCHVTKTDLK